MSASDNIQNILSGLTKAAKKTYKNKKTDMKINALEKRLTEQLLKLGALVYECKSNGIPADNEKTDKICEEIDAINNKKAAISAQKPAAKKPHAQASHPQKQGSAAEQKETVYVTLDRKENDLKIQRTSEGLKFLKFCPECKTGNDPDKEQCAICGHEFS